MAGFQQKTIGEILTFQRGFDITKKEQTPGVVPIVSSSGISSFHSQFKVKAPGVVIGRKGTLGTVHYIKQDFWPHDTTLWVKDFKGNDPRFISYFLKTLHLENFDTGSSNPTLNRNHLHKIKIIFTGLKIQQKIAAILSAYDDLIENNKRRIALLEKMAEEIYREWFVRFRFPYWENAEFEKGIPVGWEVVRFRDVVKYYIGGGWGKKKRVPTTLLAPMLYGVLIFPLLMLVIIQIKFIDFIKNPIINPESFKKTILYLKFLVAVRINY